MDHSQQGASNLLPLHLVYMDKRATILKDPMGQIDSTYEDRSITGHLDCAISDARQDSRHIHAITRSKVLEKNHGNERPPLCPRNSAKVPLDQSLVLSIVELGKVSVAAASLSEIPGTSQLLVKQAKKSPSIAPMIVEARVFQADQHIDFWILTDQTPGMEPTWISETEFTMRGT